MADSFKKILVIKLGALGDFIQALGPMAAIRKHHPDAHISLLTTMPFEGFARDCGYFNEVYIDERPRWYNLHSWMRLRRFFNDHHFERVYDLQNNDRTSFYFKLFKKKNRPEWVGAVKGASHSNTSPQRTAGHAFDGHVQTLALAGITGITIDTLEWMDGNIASFALKSPYVLLAPGSAPGRKEKRWPAAHYGRLAQILAQCGFQPVVLGTKAEKEAARVIHELCPQTLNLTGQTTLKEIVALGRGAATAIGNDTGPMHLIAATGCPCIVLFSQHSDPVRHAPKGQAVQIIQKKLLDTLTPEEILDLFKPREDASEKPATMH